LNGGPAGWGTRGARRTRVVALVVSVLVASLALAVWAGYGAAGDPGMAWRDTAADAPEVLTVSQVTPEGAAAAVGVLPGDRIFGWNGWPVTDPTAPFRRPLDFQAGERAVLTIRRFVPSAAPGVAGSYRPEEQVEIVFRPALVRAAAALTTATAIALLALVAGAVLALRRPWRTDARVAWLGGTYVALTALASPAAFVALRLDATGAWLLVGVVIAIIALPLAPVVTFLPTRSRYGLLLVLFVFAGMTGVGWVRVARSGDDGLRVRPVSRQGLLVVRAVPGSAADAAGLGGGQRVVVGVDGYVSRDALYLWRRFRDRSPDVLGSLQVQGSASGGTGTGLGAVWDGHVQLQPRLVTPHVVSGLAASSLTGLATLAVSVMAASRRPRAGWLVPAGVASALLAVAQVWVASGSVPWQLVAALDWPGIPPHLAEVLAHAGLGVPAMAVLVAGLRVLTHPASEE